MLAGVAESVSRRLIWYFAIRRADEPRSEPICFNPSGRRSGRRAGGGRHAPEPRSHRSIDGCCSDLGIIVLPHHHEVPALGRESRRSVRIAKLSRPEFLRPPVGIRLRRAPVLWACMPEATSNVHCHASCGEDDVNASPYSWHDSTMKAIPQPSTVECASQADLRHRVLPALTLHASARLLIRGTWSGHVPSMHADGTSGYSRSVSMSSSTQPRQS